jgi:hypothetical protein
MKAIKQWGSDREFEEDAIRIARSLWPGAHIGGSVILDGRERDGVFVTEEAVHIVECTVSRSKQKAVDDIDKSIKLARKLKVEYNDKSIQCWFITAEEPTADQRSVASSKSEFRVVSASYSQFRSRLIDAPSYINMRYEYSFGSARNIKDGATKFDRDDYIPLDLLRVNDSSIFSTKEICNSVSLGNLKKIIFLGDYGAGKSMSLRDIYFRLVDSYNNGESYYFPIYINLRDHSGQSDPTEVLERHARRIGFPRPDHLVRAWRAGYVILILDGFDELSSTGWLAFNSRLRDVRYKTVEAVRKFLNENPVHSPVIVAGRSSYFDDEDECLRAFGISKDNVSIFSLNDFSEKQIGKFLYRLGIQGEVPQWLPARPLLVGYLAIRGVLSKNSIPLSQTDPGEGWDNLLNYICTRESKTHEAVDASTVRHLVEYLASVARSKGGLSALLSPVDLISAYRSVVGLEPDDTAETLLMRLPGLGGSSERPLSGVDGGATKAEGGLRAFIDTDFGAAAAAGDVFRFLENPFNIQEAPVFNVKEVLPDLGISVLAHQIKNKLMSDGKIFFGLNVAGQHKENFKGRELAADILKLISSGGFAEPKEKISINIEGVIFDNLDFEDCYIDLSGVTLEDSMISNLYFPSSLERDHRFPQFMNCDIDHVEGRLGESGLLKEKFRDVIFGSFSELPATNSAILNDAALEIGLKALIVVLRKLFVQKGSGRKENAFYRGIPGISHGIIDQVLNLLKTTDYAARIKTGGAEPFWVPNRRMGGRVGLILTAPKMSSEAIVSAARKFGVR